MTRARRRRRSLAVVVFGVVCAAIPDAAGACAVCFSVEEDTRIAYYLTTALMMLAPFTALGAIALWLGLAARKAQRQRDSDSRIDARSATR